jgi:tetratricopeptide (TPR) repeat protein
LALRKLNENLATAAQCRTRHCHYFLGLLATQAELLNGAQAAQVGAALGLDLDNIRHAWRCAAEGGDGARLRQSAAGLAAFFAHMGLGYEGAQLLQTAVASLPPQTTADNDWLPYLLTKQLSLLETFNPLAEIKPVIERILALTESDPALAHLQAETYLLWSMGLLEEQASPQQARVYLDKAFASAANSDDPVLAAWLTCELGRNYLYDGQFEKAILVLQEALATFESLGHLPGQASVYSRLAPAYAEAYNLGPALVCDQEALRIYSQINYRTKLSRAHNNLAETLALFGAYLPAHDHACKSLALSRQQNDKVNEANTLTIYATCLEKLGQTEEAEKQYRTAITAQKALNLSFALRFALLDWGDFLMRNGRSAEAAVTFADALAVNQELEHLRLTSQAKLATAYLAQGKSDAALTLADEVWPAIEPTGGSGLPFPIHTMVECYTVFQAHGDGRAGDALDMAAVVMERTAVAIDDPEMRASFLNNVPVNRQLQAALQQASAVETPTPPPIRPQAAIAVTDPRHRFVVQKMLAVGGQGELYLGHDRLTEERVVVKQLKAELLAQDPQLVQRLVQEGEILRRLNHPNVVQMLAAYEIDGVHHIVMEYVPGGTLRDLLNQTPQLSLSQTLAIGLELADALSRAHHLNVIHRDIKPDNVLLAADGTPRLTDFGVARLMEKGGAGLTQAGLTQAGALIGSLAYMSPEALRGEAPDARSDIWSFGALLFEMLAGFHPYDDQSEQVTAVLIKILSEPPPDLLAYCPDAPPALLELLQKMLVKERNGRIASMRQVAAALEAIRDDLLAASAQGSV